MLDKISDLFARRFGELTTGSHEGDYDLGPLINAKQHRRVCGMVAKARSEGVPVLAEGRIALDQLIISQLPQMISAAADGLSNAETAAQLFIGERTVESHVASIFNKLGVDSRVEVARWGASLEDGAEA